MSNKFKILNYNNFNYDKIDYYQPQKTLKKELLTSVSYRLTQDCQIPIYIETPRLKTPSGIIKCEEDDDNYYIELEIDVDTNTSSFFDFITKVDEINIINCQMNSCNWFNKNIPLETVEEFYQSPIKLQDGSKNPKIALKIPRVNNKLILEVFNEQKEQIGINSIEKDDEMISIIRFVGLRFLNKEFKSVWEIFKVKLLKEITEEMLPTGYLFSDTQVDVNPTTEMYTDGITANNIEPSSEPEISKLLEESESKVETATVTAIAIAAETADNLKSIIDETMDIILPKNDNIAIGDDDTTISNIPFPLAESNDDIEINDDVNDDVNDDDNDFENDSSSDDEFDDSEFELDVDDGEFDEVFVDENNNSVEETTKNEEEEEEEEDIKKKQLQLLLESKKKQEEEINLLRKELNLDL